jgi:cell division protein FtsB
MATSDYNIKEIVAQIAQREKRAFRRSWMYSGIALVVAVLWLSYTVYKTNQLANQAASLTEQITVGKKELQKTEQELDKKKKELNSATALTGLTAEQLIALYDFGSGQILNSQINKNLVQQSFEADAARKEGASPSDTSRRSEITIQFFPKDVDKDKVTAALHELGFKLDQRSAKVPDVATNAIWFGTDVNPEDAKLVAYTLMRAGIQIKSFERFNDSSGGYNGVPKTSLIQVGANRALVNDRSLTVDEIRAKRF